MEHSESSAPDTAHVSGMTTPIQLNVARPEHGQRIAEMAAESRGRKQVAKGDAQQIALSTLEPGHLWLIASAGDQIVGYVAAVPISHLAVEVDNIYVERRYRGGGIGTAMTKDAFRILRDRGVSVAAISTTARNADWLAGLGVQLLDEGDSLGLATADGGFFVVKPRASERRPRIGVGFMEHDRPTAVAWSIRCGGLPSSSDVAQSFYDTFRQRRTEVDPVVPVQKAVTALAKLGRLDLVAEWLNPGAVTASI